MTGNNDPPWVKKFRQSVERMEELAGKGNWYDFNQPYLSQLKKTGRGNCVAWSKLMIEIATDAGLETIVVVFEDARTKWGSDWPHQICVIVDKDNDVWCQDNIRVYRLKRIRGRLSRKKIVAAIKQAAQKSAKMFQFKGGARILTMSQRKSLRGRGRII